MKLFRYFALFCSFQYFGSGADFFHLSAQFKRTSLWVEQLVLLVGYFWRFERTNSMKTNDLNYTHLLHIFYSSSSLCALSWPFAWMNYFKKKKKIYSVREKIGAISNFFFSTVPLVVFPYLSLLVALDLLLPLFHFGWTSSKKLLPKRNVP